MFAREVSAQLGEQGWQSVLCFLSEPEGEVRRFLELPNVSFATLGDSTEGGLPAYRDLFRILKKHRADTLHLHFVGFLTFYPWIAKLAGVKQTFFTDHHSRPAGYVARRAPGWKRAAARMIGCAGVAATIEEGLATAPPDSAPSDPIHCGWAGRNGGNMDQKTVTAGTTLGMLFSDGLAIFAGHALSDRIAPKTLRWAAAALFFAFALVSAWRAFARA